MPEIGGGDFTLVDHTPMIYLFGPEGELLILLPPIVPPERMAVIVRGYLG